MIVIEHFAVSVFECAFLVFAFLCFKVLPNDEIQCGVPPMYSLLKYINGPFFY